MNSIVYFTKYSQEGPSSRYRSFNYKSILEKNFCVEYSPLFDAEYVTSLYTNRRTKYFRIFLLYVNRIISVLKHIRKDKLFIIEYELLPYFPPILEMILNLFKEKIIYDFDDAIFHNYDIHPRVLVRFLYGNKISKIVSSANYVITGSPYLSNYLSRFNSNLVEIPTSVIFSKYSVSPRPKFEFGNVVIGWIGSKSTSSNVLSILEVINIILNLYPEVVFKFMGLDQELKAQLNLPNVELLNWSEQEELKFLNDIDLGIMPLEDNPFNRGKCGFKLIQYMAMGKPTISSPLEANVKINRNSSNLFARNTQEWVDCIIEFYENRDFYKEVGLKNRQIVKEFYSVETNSETYLKLFNKLVNVRN